MAGDWSAPIWAFQIAWNAGHPGRALRESGKIDPATEAALLAGADPALRAFQTSWNRQGPGYLAVPVTGTLDEPTRRAIAWYKRPKEDTTMTPILFSKLAQVTRTMVPPAGQSGFDTAVSAALGKITSQQADLALAKMTRANQEGFATGIALRQGLTHPYTQDFLQRTTQLAVHAAPLPGVHGGFGATPPPPSGGPINLYPGTTFTPEQIAAMQAAYTAPGGLASIQAKAASGQPLTMAEQMTANMAKTSLDIATGKPPANAAEANAQITIAKLVSGMVVGAGSPYLGPALGAALGGGAAASAAALHPITIDPVARAGAAAHAPSAAAVASVKGFGATWAKVVAWFKSILTPAPSH